jgi:adenylate cyclase
LLRWHGRLDDLGSKGVPVLSAAPFITEGRPIIKRVQDADPDLRPEKIFEILKKEPVLTGATANLIRGRTVFVASNARATFDFKPLPVGDVQPGVLLHWTAWTNLAGSGFIQPLSRPVVLVGALLMSGAIIWAGRRQIGLAAPLWMAGFLAVIFIGGSYALLSAGWYVPPATPTAAVLLTLLGVVAETLWVEQARKREIQSMFGAYVDPEVVAQLVRNPDSIELGGERREATVFFSDLAGFTDLSNKPASACTDTAHMWTSTSGTQ